MTTTTSTHDVISSDRVEGTTVYNTAGEKLGTIDDLMIDKISGQVRYAVMEFGGFLGMGTDRYPIPWNMLDYDTSQEGYVVPLDKATLEARRAIRETACPTMTRLIGPQWTSTTGFDAPRPACVPPAPHLRRPPRQPPSRTALRRRPSSALFHCRTLQAQKRTGDAAWQTT